MNKERGAMNKVNQETYALLFKSLMDEPQSTHELVEVTGLHLVTVQSLMRVLKRHKVIHIFGWDTDRLGRDTTPIFKLGHGRNKPRRKKTAAERQAQYRAKKAQINLLRMAA